MLHGLVCGCILFSIHLNLETRFYTEPVPLSQKHSWYSNGWQDEPPGAGRGRRDDAAGLREVTLVPLLYKDDWAYASRSSHPPHQPYTHDHWVLMAAPLNDKGT